MVLNADVFLLNSDNTKPKAEIGYNESGNFSFDFKAVSIGDDTVQYEPTITVLTEDTVSENGVVYMAQKARKLSDDEVSVTIPKKITVDPNGETPVNVKIELTEKGKANLKAQFPNGIYIEGFVTMTPIQNDEVSLSYPFMGFFGDWQALNIFDSDIYDDEPASICETQIGQFRNSDGGGYILGHNYYVDGATEYNANKIAIKGSETGKNVTAAVSLLRNVDKLTFSVDDSDGNTVYSESSTNVSKSYHSSEGYYTPMAAKGWAPFDVWNTPLDDGNYVYKITATLGRHEETKAFPIVIDSVPPEVISSRIEGTKWIVTVHDNHFIQGVCATATGNEPITKWIEPDATSADTTSEITFDLSASGFKGLTQAKIALIDYAGNTYISDYYSLSAAEVIYPQSVTLDKSALVLTEGESAVLNAEIMPQNASNRTVSWSISDTDVAQISASGKVTAKKAGNAVITVQTVNGIKASCDITVNEKKAETLPITAAVSVKKNTLTGNIIPFRFQLGNIKKVATVSFTFQKDDALQFESLIGKNGFTSLGIKWNNDNTATIALSYLQNGAGGSLTKNELFDAAEVQFKEILNDMPVGIRLVDVSAAGYDKNGKAVYFTTKITAESANTNVTKKSSCDVNADGVVDLLDITYCQKFYRMGEKSIDWNDFKHCDLDGNGLIDIEDLIIILKVM